MPSLFHEALLELFRNRAELTRELLRILCPDQLPALDQSTAESASIDLSQVTSTEYRADQVTVFRRADRSAILAVVVEVQLRRRGEYALAHPRVDREDRRTERG